jgi:hypothetical protein
MATMIQKIAQGPIDDARKRLRAQQRVIGGATTGLFAGATVGSLTGKAGVKALLIGAGLGALFGAAAEHQTRSIEDAQREQIREWSKHYTTKRNRQVPFRNAEFGNVARGRPRARIMAMAR